MNAQLDPMDLLGMNIARVDRWQLLDHLFEELDFGRGGWVITANLDFLRRFTKDHAMRALYAAADIRVADGMPLVWASRLTGAPVPERVAGSELIGLLTERAAREGRSLDVLGGAPGAARAAAEKLEARWPGLRIAGQGAPRVSMPPRAEEVEAIAAELARAQPDIVLVGLGSPKQELLIQALRPRFPRTWMMGVGISFSFVAGTVRRAPVWVQRAGLEWLHRLAQEPRRLARRYLIEDLPFSFELCARALMARSLRRLGARAAAASGSQET